MGVIDKNTAIIRCPQCGTSETLTALEKGCSFQSGGWTGFSKSTRFEYTQVDGEIGPKITNAKCLQCDIPATVEKDHRHGHHPRHMPLLHVHAPPRAEYFVPVSYPTISSITITQAFGFQSGNLKEWGDGLSNPIFFTLCFWI